MNDFRESANISQVESSMDTDVHKPFLKQFLLTKVRCSPFLSVLSEAMSDFVGSVNLMLLA